MKRTFTKICYESGLLSRRARVGLISALGNKTDSRDIRPKPNSRLCISSLQPLELQDQAEHTLHRGEEGQSGRAIKINQSTRHFRVVFSERNTWHSVVAHAPTRTLTNTLLIPGPVNMTNDIVRLPTHKQLTHGPRCLPLSSFRQPTPSYSHCLVKNLPFFILVKQGFIMCITLCNIVPKELCI